jgi:hypothetical protein
LISGRDFTVLSQGSFWGEKNVSFYPLRAAIKETQIPRLRTKGIETVNNYIFEIVFIIAF